MYNQRLTPAQVREMVRLYDDGATLEELSGKYTLCVSSVSRIMTGKSYAAVTGGVNRSRESKLSEYRRVHIAARLEQGRTSYSGIARELGISRQAVWSLAQKYDLVRSR